MNYMERLKATHSGKQADKPLPLLPKGTLGSKGSDQSGHFPQIDTPPTVANPLEEKYADLSVTVYTPAGTALMVQARDAEHAEWLKRMNPKPTAQALVLKTPDNDDRRHCAECANLSHAGRCLAAWRGEILAGRHYKPIDDLPRRCNGYAPKANDPDQRTGAERWPGPNCNIKQYQIP